MKRSVNDYSSLWQRIKNEKKIYLISLVLVLIADGIGEVTFKIGNGVIIFFPVFYAIILGIMLGPQVLKIIRPVETTAAGKLVLVGICPFIVKLGITAGANLHLILNAGPALLLHGFGSLLGPILALPIAMLLGLHRETIGACSSLNREYHLAVINNAYGAESAESNGSLALYIVGGMIGAIFMASASASLANAFPAHAAVITTMASASNTIAGITGIYITMWLALPLTEKYYDLLCKIFRLQTQRHLKLNRG